MYVAPTGPLKSPTGPLQTTRARSSGSHAAAIRSVERSDRLDALLAGGADTATVVALRCARHVRDEIPRRIRHALHEPSTVQARPRDLPLARAHLGALTDGVAEETVDLLVGDDRPDARATKR